MAHLNIVSVPQTGKLSTKAVAARVLLARGLLRLNKHLHPETDEREVTLTLVVNDAGWRLFTAPADECDLDGCLFAQSRVRWGEDVDEAIADDLIDHIVKQGNP